MGGRGTPKKLDQEALWEYALRALSESAKSAAELKRKLSARAQSSADVTATMAKLREYGFADDQKFSEVFAASRLENRGFGSLRIRRELAAKRVAPVIAERAIEKTFAGVEERDLIDRFLEKKYRGKNLPEFLKEEKNLASAYRKLRNAGFTHGNSLSALKRYARQVEEWSEIPEDE